MILLKEVKYIYDKVAAIIAFRPKGEEPCSH